MTAVSVIDGVKYGFKLIIYVLGVMVLGIGFIGVGGFMVATSESVRRYVLAGIPIIVGGLVVYAGFLGTGYKMIADAVKKGNEEAR